jgi:hypothetical protein
MVLSLLGATFKVWPHLGQYLLRNLLAPLDYRPEMAYLAVELAEVAGVVFVCPIRQSTGESNREDSR